MKRSFFLFLFCLFIHRDVQSCIYPYETPTAKYLKSFELTETHSGLDLIDCIYVINLDERMVKWDHLQPLLEERGIHANRFSAINGWKLPQTVFKELRGNYPERGCPGIIGCFLSHISIIKDAYERGFETIWILEDDIEFLEDIQQIPMLIEKLSEYDPEWDVLYTDTNSRNETGYFLSVSSDFRPDRAHKPLSYYLEKTPIDPDLIKIHQRFGMRSYVLSRRGIQKILNYFTHVYFWTAVDIDIHYIPEIREYTPTKDIVTNPRKRLYCDTGKNSTINLQ